MITDLHISNYALIDSIDLTFGPGLMCKPYVLS